ncbi:helix-turn-helix domain-containing protein [Serratia ureilytica]|uniref:helix-turn-helix domain-containing protein n=1 Tax=Serratia ureilytica TaxID=300181 RepID=UPI0018DA2D7D|nr:helix-turn-helix transcriptional regulator [Serratia ureilytica]MBH3122416.1 hypothetical protein [Serratia ureilytica]
MAKLPSGVTTITRVLNNTAISQTQLAECLGISRATLRKYMTDTSGNYHIIYNGKFYSRPAIIDTSRNTKPVAFTSPGQLKKYPSEQREVYGRYSEKFCIPLFMSPQTPVVPRELMNCLAFFASVIKSGEPWTETCQRDYDTAIKAATPKVSGSEA